MPDDSTTPDSKQPTETQPDAEKDSPSPDTEQKKKPPVALTAAPSKSDSKAKSQGPQRAKLPPGYIFLWVISLASLLFNFLLIRELLEVRSAAGQAIADAAVIIEGFGGETFTYTFKLEDTLNIQTEIPVDETIPVVIDETLPISTVVNVPINTPLGSTSANVPINTTVPIELDVEVELEQTFEVQAAVPIDLEVPISLSVEETPLAGTLDDIVLNLNRIADDLNRPLISIGSGTDTTDDVLEVTATPVGE